MTARTENVRLVGYDLLTAVIVLMSWFAAIAAVVAPINQLTQPGGQVSVALSPAGAEQALGAVQGLPPGTGLELGEGYPVQFHVQTLDWPLRLLTESGTSLLLLCLAGCGFLIARTIRSIRQGTPFEVANPRRLRLIGALLLVGGMGSQYLEGITRIVLLDTTGMPSPGPVEISASLDLTWLVAGGLALVMAAAFARGRALTDDVTGLV